MVTMWCTSRVVCPKGCGELAKGKCLHGGQRLRYKDVVKRHLKATHIALDTWEALAQDRQQWMHKGKSHIEENISKKYKHDHNLHHSFPDASAPTAEEAFQYRFD